MNIGGTGCSEDLVPSPGRILMYCSGTVRFFRTGTGDSHGKGPSNGKHRRGNNRQSL
jgi:hypothetical protein